MALQWCATCRRFHGPQSRIACQEWSERRTARGKGGKLPTTRLGAVAWSLWVGLLIGGVAGALTQDSTVALGVWGVCTVLLSVWRIRALK